MEKTVAKVKAEAEAQTSANIFEKATAAENIKDTTAINHLVAVSEENSDDKNLEIVVDEAEDLELYSNEFAEEVAAENFPYIVSEKDAATQNAAPSRVAIRTAASRVAEPEEIKGTSDSPSATENVIKTGLSLPNDSGPLHGDRLRKYQLRYRLTNRETEVLWEILQKHKIAEIASNLYITLPTAKYHISNILQKTGMRNQRELRYLIQKEEL